MLMSSFRRAMHSPTLPRRSKLAQSVAMTQSNFWPRLRLLKIAVRVEEAVFLRHGVLVPAHDLLAFGAQGEREAELGADAIAVGPHVADDADRLRCREWLRGCGR